MNSEDIKSILKDMGRSAQKLRGQHFLVDENVLKKIIRTSGVKKGERVLEIGPGLGVLTLSLIAEGAIVHAVEIDPQFAERLQKLLTQLNGPAQKPKVIEQDILQADFGALMGHKPYSVIANIPYNITSRLLERLVHNAHRPISATLLVQKEVARRVIPGQKTNPLSLLVALHAKSTIACMVGSGAFYPPPKVESAVLHLAFHNDYAEIHEAVERLSCQAFREPRKKIANTLGFSKETFAAIGLSGNERPEEVALDLWIALAKKMPKQ